MKPGTRTVPSLNCLADLDDVPQVVHLSWKNKDLLASRSPVVLNGVKNIVAMNPGWRVIISDDHDVEMYLKEQLSHDDYNLIKRRHIVKKVDLWRLLKMYHEGGFYTDIDRYYNVPLSSLHGPRTNCLLPMHYDIDFAQDVMLSAPNNPIHGIAIDLNLARRRQGCTDKWPLGPITYFHAVTTVLCGRAIDRYPSPDVVQDLRDKIHGSEYIETYREDPPHNTMTFHYDETTWQSGTGDSLDEFYDNEGVTHWTGDCPDLPDNKPFGP